MISLSNTFRAELDRPIRRAGHCNIIFFYKSGGSYTVPQYTVQSVEIHDTGDPLSRQLPTEECTITLTDFQRLWDPTNPNGNYSRIEAGITMLVRFGIYTGNGTEYSDDYEHFISDKVPTWTDYKATFHGVKLLATWDKIFDDFTNQSLLEVLAEDVIKSMFPPNTSIASLIDFDYDRLNDVPVISHAKLDQYSVRDALLAIAFAGRCGIKTNNNEQVAIKDFWGTDAELNPAVISKNDMMSVPVASRLPKIRNEVVKYYTNPAETPATANCLNAAVDADIDGYVSGADPYFVRFNTPIVPSSLVDHQENLVEGFFLYSVTKTGIRITNAYRTDQSIPFKVTGTGTPLTPAESTNAVQINASGTDDEEIDNPLLNESNAADVAAYRGEILSKTRTLYTFDYRGDPSIQSLDILRVELPNGQTTEMCQCMVVERTFRFEDGFSGSLSVRKIDSPNSDQVSHVAVSDLAVSDEAISDTDTAIPIVQK